MKFEKVGKLYWQIHKKMLLYMHSSFGTIYKTYYTTGLHQI